MHSEEKTVCGVDKSSSSSSSHNSDEDGVVTPRKCKYERPINIITIGVAAALDRTNISDGKATYLLAADVQSLGHDRASLALNKESIRLARRGQRERDAAAIKDSFAISGPLAVHWD